MNKGRIEAFTDAVIAIILTIMILEFKVPSSLKFTAILTQVPYLISYAIGYLFIGTAWYNHHYMFSKTKVTTQRIFWANNAWMFATSFLPVATAWVGKDLFAQGPQIFYAIVYTVWSLSYVALSAIIAQANAQHGFEPVAASIRRMAIYRYLSNWKIWVAQTIVLVAVLYYYPALQLVLVFLQIILVGMRFNDDSDKIFDSAHTD